MRFTFHQILTIFVLSNIHTIWSCTNPEIVGGGSNAPELSSYCDRGGIDSGQIWKGENGFTGIAFTIDYCETKNVVGFVLKNSRHQGFATKEFEIEILNSEDQSWNSVASGSLKYPDSDCAQLEVFSTKSTISFQKVRFKIISFYNSTTGPSLHFFNLIEQEQNCCNPTTSGVYYGNLDMFSTDNAIDKKCVFDHGRESSWLDNTHRITTLTIDYCRSYFIEGFVLRNSYNFPYKNRWTIGYEILVSLDNSNWYSVIQSSFNVVNNDTANIKLCSDVYEPLNEIMEIRYVKFKPINYYLNGIGINYIGLQKPTENCFNQPKIIQENTVENQGFYEEFSASKAQFDYCDENALNANWWASPLGSEAKGIAFTLEYGKFLNVAGFRLQNSLSPTLQALNWGTLTGFKVEGSLDNSYWYEVIHGTLNEPGATTCEPYQYFYRETPIIVRYLRLIVEAHTLNGATVQHFEAIFTNNECELENVLPKADAFHSETSNPLTNCKTTCKNNQNCKAITWTNSNECFLISTQSSNFDSTNVGVSYTKYCEIEDPSINLCEIQFDQENIQNYTILEKNPKNIRARP